MRLVVLEIVFGLCLIFAAVIRLPLVSIDLHRRLRLLRRRRFVKCLRCVMNIET